MDKNKYLELIKKTNEAATAYYDNDAPVMEDPEYDELMKQIKVFEKEHPDMIAPDSLTQRVGGSTGKSLFEKVTHAVPMLSLQDVFSYDEVSDFLAAAGDENTIYSVEHKIDGLSLSVTLKDDKTGDGTCVLVRGETRGDGHTGENVTENIRFIDGIPERFCSNKKLGKIALLEVRCEVYLPIPEFERLNKELLDAGKKPFANPRNAAAGLLRTKDANAVKNAHLSAFAFNVQRIELAEAPNPNPWTCQCLSLNALEKLGFEPVFHQWTGADGVRKIIEEIGEKRNSLPYWIDGSVIKIDSIEERNKLGETGKYPKWAVAYKYPPEEKETVVRDIILQTGRTGRVTPVAVFDPVFLAGTKVEKATLHNPEIIAKLGINVNDTVLIRKAAEIIPEVVKVIKPACCDEGMATPKSVYDIFAHSCPSCGGEIVPGTDESGNDEAGAYCMNPDCPAKLSRHLEFWCSRDCMDITGMGPAVIDRFIEKGWLKSVSDIYRLKNHADEMVELEGFGKKAAEKLFSAIEDSKTRDIDRLIKSLGIIGVGRHIGKALAARYADMWTIVLDVPLADLMEIEGIGDISARVMRDEFKRKEFRLMLQELEELGINMKSKSCGSASDTKNSVFTGLTFVITGTLPTMKREEAAALIESNGGKVSGSVSKKTDYLLCGEAAGSKLDKAKALGVKVISEKELTDMLI